ncbi:unnamed protein product [Closterium sp. Naga37s-1]|nr:unnamed protein product [Closterium sp. Naga37s-1]
MRLGGYLDRRTTLANPANQPTPRVWIRELGFVWQAPVAGEESTGKGRKDRPLGDELSLFDGQATVTMDAHEKSGPGSADVDKYTIRIEGLLEAEIRVRAAHPLLQRDGDAMVHLNLELEQVHYSMDVHGVLGQMYRDEAMEEGTNLDYSVISALLTDTVRAEKAADENSTSDQKQQQQGSEESRQTEGSNSFLDLGKSDVEDEGEGSNNGGDRAAVLDKIRGALRTSA